MGKEKRKNIKNSIILVTIGLILLFFGIMNMFEVEQNHQFLIIGLGVVTFTIGFVRLTKRTIFIS
jgi:general stress protein CsbA